MSAVFSVCTEQIDLGVGHDKALGQDGGEIARDAFGDTWMLVPKTVKRDSQVFLG